jgi:hypothetical protein
VLSAPGFDTCAAPDVEAMAAWHAASRYQAIGIYVGGSNRGCAAGNLSADWVHTVTAQGWSLIPIYVGLQAPCAREKKGMSTMSAADPARQGGEAADDAASSARALDLAAGSPVYFDLEAFDPGDIACVRTVTAFLGAWTARLHAHGYLAAVYGSADSGMATLAGIVHSQPDFAAPDAVWIAHWDRQATTADPSVPEAMWSHHQRIKQYQGGHVERHGGVSLSIDSDWLDGPVARISP